MNKERSHGTSRFSDRADRRAHRLPTESRGGRDPPRVRLAAPNAGGAGGRGGRLGGRPADFQPRGVYPGAGGFSFLYVAPAPPAGGRQRWGVPPAAFGGGGARDGPRGGPP